MLRPLIRLVLSITAIGAVLVAVLVWDGRLGMETRLVWNAGEPGEAEEAPSDVPDVARPSAGKAPGTVPESASVAAPAPASEPAGMPVVAETETELGTTAAPAEDEGAATQAIAALSPPDGAPAAAPEAPVERGPSGVEGQEDRPPPTPPAGPDATVSALGPAGGQAVPDDRDGGPGAVPAVDPDAPVFDIVRVNPDGSAVIAGRGKPGETIDLLRDGEPIAQAVVDARGNFAMIAEIGSIDAPLALQLRAERASDATSSAGTAAGLATVEVLRPGIASAVAGPVPEEGDGVAEGGALSSVPEPAQTVGVLGAPVLLLPAEETGVAPSVVQAAPDAVALADPGAAPVASMVLDSVSYDPGGDAVARGRSPAGARVRVFVNNAPVAEAEASESGAWEATLPQAAAAEAELLRFEEVTPEGAVRRRLETRFDYAPGDGPLAVEERTIVVERGDSLWRIAENLYGEGLRYSVIFGANDALIVDPDLIYPEQVFVVPDLVPGNGAAETSPTPSDRPVGAAD